MKHNVRYQELNDEQLEQVVGGSGVTGANIQTIVQSQRNTTVQTAAAAVGSAALNANATTQTQLAANSN